MDIQIQLGDMKLILASQSPRRRELLTSWGLEFQVIPANDSAESGLCGGESAHQFVARMAFQKAKDVVARIESGVVIAADTVAHCRGQILGKPVDRDHAKSMLQLMSGKIHYVLTGICVWDRETGIKKVDVDTTQLKMAQLSDEKIEEYLDTDKWIGKAGAFGYQDELDWISIETGSESNVVGLPQQLLLDTLVKLKSDIDNA
jgi:septum formation protein